MSEVQTVFVVDDNAEMRRMLCEYLRTADLHVQDFDSGKAFLAFYKPTTPGCLLLDIQMPEMTGFQLQELLQSMDVILPTIIVSGHNVVHDVVKSMKFGPFDFIEKPYNPQILLERIHQALAQDQKRRKLNTEMILARQRYASLTQREQEILASVVKGSPSKMIAQKLSLSTSTVDNHRANILKKLKAATSADLTRIALLVDPALAFSPES